MAAVLQDFFWAHAEANFFFFSGSSRSHNGQYYRSSFKVFWPTRLFKKINISSMMWWSNLKREHQRRRSAANWCWSGRSHGSMNERRWLLPFPVPWRHSFAVLRVISVTSPFIQPAGAQAQQRRHTLNHALLHEQTTRSFSMITPSSTIYGHWYKE